MRSVVKALVRALAVIVVSPALVSFQIRRRIFGDAVAFEASTHLLSLLPGVTGDYLRRAFLMHATERCAASATVRFGTVLSDPRAVIDANVYVGPRCHLGFVHLERDVLLAAGVHVPSGASSHGTADPNLPIRDQPATRMCVRIGEGTWVGSAAVVMADVGKHCVIGAGAVVTKPLPDFVVAVGVPARVVKVRVSSEPAR